MFSSLKNSVPPNGSLNSSTLWQLELIFKDLGLEESCLQCWWGAAMWPSRLSDQNSGSCLCGEKGIATASTEGIYPTQGWNLVSSIAGGFFVAEAPGKPKPTRETDGI